MKQHIMYSFPVKEISDECRREKSVREGHISTIQMWWARRPLAVSKAAIFSSLCPDADTIDSNQRLKELLNQYDDSNLSTTDKINNFIIELSNWDNRRNTLLHKLAGDILKASYVHTPLVADPFSGGGSIPLEALYLGLDSYAGELNPVAYYALKAELEYLPKLTEEDIGAIKCKLDVLSEKVANTFDSFYPKINDITPVAYLWVRTFLCPKCGAESLLLPNKWLRKPKDRKEGVAVRIKYVDNRSIFEVYSPKGKDEVEDANEGTVKLKNIKCSKCGVELSTDYIQKIGRENNLGERMVAVCYYNASQKEYTVPTEDCEFNYSKDEIEKIDNAFPSEEFDVNGIRHTWAYQYGIKTTGDLYNYRQKKALLLMAQLIEEERNFAEGLFDKKEVAEAYKSILILLFNRINLYCNRHTWWQANGEFAANMYGHNSIPMVWSYIEVPIHSKYTAGWYNACKWILSVCKEISYVKNTARVELSDAKTMKCKDNSVDLLITDPPYYDSIAYSYLSDVFYVWMKKLLGKEYPSVFSERLTPKADEAIVDRYHSMGDSIKTDSHYRRKMKEAFDESNRVLKDNGIMVVMYGHKKLTAWEAIIEPIIEAGFEFVNSWPVYMERKEKYKHNKIVSLSLSSLLICKKKINKSKKAVPKDVFLEILGRHIYSKIDENVKHEIIGVDLETSLYIPACSLMSEYTVDDNFSISKLLELLPDIIEKALVSYIMNYTRDYVDLSDAKTDWDMEEINPDESVSENDYIKEALTLANIMEKGDLKSFDEKLYKFNKQQMMIIVLIQKYMAIKAKERGLASTVVFDTSISRIGLFIRKE